MCSPRSSTRSRSSSSTTPVRRPTGSEPAGSARRAVSRSTTLPGLPTLASMTESIENPEPTFVLTSEATPPGSIVAPQQLVEALGGENLSPDLSWENAPEGTKSFAVTSLPLGVARDDASLLQAKNDFGNPGYDGPEPPAGAPHRYVFSVHALPVETLGADPADPHIGARFAIFSQQLASASFTARYQVTA